MAYDPVERLALVRDLPWPFPYEEPLPDEYFRGEFSSRHPLNVPGPFYGAETDTCCCGMDESPRCVLFDHEAMEFVWRQPRDDQELRSLMSAAYSDPFSGYGKDGDQHWTPVLVRDWWATRQDRQGLVEQTWDYHLPAGLKGAPPLTATVLADWSGYLHSDQLGRDLRRYLYRLEEGVYPDGDVALPDL